MSRAFLVDERQKIHDHHAEALSDYHHIDSLPTNASQTTTATTTRQPLYRRSPLLFVGGGLALVLFTALLVVVERRPNNNLQQTATTSADGSAGTPGSSEYTIQQKAKKRV